MLYLNGRHRSNKTKTAVVLLVEYDVRKWNAEKVNIMHSNIYYKFRFKAKRGKKLGLRFLIENIIEL